MTAQFLTSELSTLIQESKRRNTDLRNASEKSLSDLKGLPNTSETQLAADLKRRPNFVRPFLIACSTRNPKYAGTAIACLQRLIASNGLPKETLKDVLEALRDCSSLGLDIQIKILQALPSLLQNYANQIVGQLLATAFEVSFLLYGSKTSVVSSTAAATLQQLVVSVLGRVALEDEYSVEGAHTEDVPIEGGAIPVRMAAFDAYRLLNDLTLLIEGQRPQFLHTTTLTPDFGFELIMSMLSNHADTICSHPEQVDVLRAKLMPMIIRILSDRVTFSTTLRAMRLLPLIFASMLSVLSSECEVVLSLLNHNLDPTAAILWKRILCMEVFRSVHSEPALVRSMYAQFDEQEGKRNIVRDNLDIMVRLSAEKPSTIGLGSQSSIPASTTPTEDVTDEEAALQAEGVAITKRPARMLKASDAPGISTQWSTMRVPCIDQLDKSEPPEIPPAYIYTLALVCVNAFSEGLARFLLPFSLPNDSRSRRRQRVTKEFDAINESLPLNVDENLSSDKKGKLSRGQSSSDLKLPINPLSLESHILYSQIKTSASMIEICWPAVLATYSTYLHSALDSEFYHALIRSFQKFTQVSGILEFSTPRDAFLTTLGKNAVPPAIIATFVVTGLTAQSRDRNTINRSRTSVQESELDHTTSPTTSLELSRQHMDTNGATLNIRNLLCMRALLNLGIALGPVLKGAWSIIFKSIQHADNLIANSTSRRRQRSNGQITPTFQSGFDGTGEYGSEVAAVKLAAARLLESCGDLPDEVFLDVLSSFRGLLRYVDDAQSREGEITIDGTQLSTAAKLQKPSALPASKVGPNSITLANAFVIENISKLIESNTRRLLDHEPALNGWNLILDLLMDVVSTRDFDSSLRFKAADVIGNLFILTTTSKISVESRDEVRERGLAALNRQVQSLYSKGDERVKASRNCDLEIHQLSLEALRSALEQYGDSLLLGWKYIFDIIISIFETPESDIQGFDEPEISSQSRLTVPQSTKLVRVSFGSVELICSDFLTSVPGTCLVHLIDTVHSFCSQHHDLNISLTSTTLYWNISDYLGQETDSLELNESMLVSKTTLYSMDLPEDLRDRKLNSFLWLRLLICLMELTTDERLEIRHGALHMIFRTFDACGNKLSPTDWMICYKFIILKIMSNNEARFQAMWTSPSRMEGSDLSGWNETAIVTIDAFASLLEHYLTLMISHKSFNTLWRDFGEYVRGFLDRRSLSLSTAVFVALSRVLSEVGEAKERFSKCTEIMWEVWRNGNPAVHQDESSRARNDNQPALTAYLHCLRELYQLKADSLDLAEIVVILAQLQTCITASTPTSYGGDVDTLTPLQAQVLSSVEMIRTDIGGSTSELIKSVASLVKLAYDGDSEDSNRKGPTYVALSKAAMDLLTLYVVTHIEDQEIHSAGALTEAVRALAVPISLKYKWHLEGKAPVTWQKATTAIVSVLTVAIPVILEHRMEDVDHSSFWRELLKGCNYIMAANIACSNNPSTIFADQAFDIGAFVNVRNLITPALGSKQISDQLRRKYTESLFQNSIIHQPHPEDLPRPDEDLLECLQSIHIGRVQALPPVPRSKMSYVLLDELFDLIAVHDSSPERIKLAQAAAPFLILRVGIVLKAYIFDQPLRGRMPQPISQKREMLYILRKLVELDSEPKAIPDAPGVISDHKKHLHRVFALVIKALRFAQRDEETQKALTDVVETVGQGFMD